MMEMGQKMGITSWSDPSKFGLSLTLGGGDVKLIDLARAYATVANYGKRPNLVSILKVTNYKNKVLEEFACKGGFQPDLASSLNDVSAATESSLKSSVDNKSDCGSEQVLDSRVAFIITDILKDNNARAPSFGTNSMLVIPEHKEVAVKTGTSNDLRDNLTIGYNQLYLVAVWVGNNDNSPMARVASGVTGASPIFNKIMGALLAQEPNHDWSTPEGLVQLPICPRTGTLACEGCPVKMEWFLEENAPQKACNPDLFTKAEGPEPVEGKESDNGPSNDPATTPTPQMPERIEFNENNILKNLIEKREKKKTTPN
jgi:membrane carboxypeptidase/penicillin-binding protein PbpC